MDFVVATANLRAHVFGIPMNSKFTIKCEFEVVQVCLCTRMVCFIGNYSQLLLWRDKFTVFDVFVH